MSDKCRRDKIESMMELSQELLLPGTGSECEQQPSQAINIFTYAVCICI